MDARRELCAAAEALDRQVSRLAEVVSDAALVLSDDERKCVAKMLDMQRALLGGVAAQIAAAEAQLARGDSAALAAELDAIMTPALPASESAAASVSQSDPQAGTPVRTPSAAPRDSTPTNQAIDFDAFPHTPTIEQLGFSRGALDVVGEDRYRVRAVGAKRVISSRHNDSSPATRPSPCAPSAAAMSIGTPLVHDIGLGGSSSFGSSMSITGLLAHPDALDSRGSDPRAARPRAAVDTAMTDSMDAPHSVATSPFGGASSTIFGGNAGRPSDALSAASITPHAEHVDFE